MSPLADCLTMISLGPSQSRKGLNLILFDHKGGGKESIIPSIHFSANTFMGPYFVQRCRNCIIFNANLVS